MSRSQPPLADHDPVTRTVQDQMFAELDPLPHSAGRFRASADGPSVDGPPFQTPFSNEQSDRFARSQLQASLQPAATKAMQLCLLTRCDYIP